MDTQKVPMAVPIVQPLLMVELRRTHAFSSDTKIRHFQRVHDCYDAFCEIYAMGGKVRGLMCVLCDQPNDSATQIC